MEIPDNIIFFLRKEFDVGAILIHEDVHLPTEYANNIALMKLTEKVFASLREDTLKKSVFFYSSDH